MAILAVTAVPAATGASSGDLVAGSTHQDFGTGDESSPQTLTNLSTTGSGDTATVTLDGLDEIIDNAEDGDISEYGGRTSSLSASQSQTYDGSWAIESAPSSSFDTMASTSGLTTYPSPGDSFQYHIYPTDSQSNIQVYYAAQSETHDPNGYSVRLRGGDDTIRLYEDGTVLDQVNVSRPTGEWLTVTVNWGTSGSHDVTVEDASGQTVATLSASSSTYTSGGIGMGSFDDGGASTYFDYIINPDAGTATSAQYVSAIHEVSNAEEAAVNISRASDVSVEATVRTDGGTVINQTTLSGTGNHTFKLDNTSSDQLETVLNVDATGENPAFELSDESILFADRDPQISGANPSGGKTVSESPVELSINVSDADFSTSQGDTVDVTFIDESDGSEIGTDTVTENGTATTYWDDVVGGENEWTVEATDEYGNSVEAGPFTFQSPDELAVRDEITGELLTDTASNLTLTFYGDTTTERRTTTDGTISLTGLPVGEELVVVAEADGFYNRRIIIDSLTQQQNVYLLNESVESVEVIFTLEDRSGDFDASNSKLYLEKAVPTENGSAETRIIAGDYFGLGRFPVVLEQDSRYNLRVENSEGQVYDPGSYTASVADIETIRIGRIQFAPPDGESYTVQHEIVDDEQVGDRLDFQFTDPAEETTDFEVAVFPRSDPDNATYEDSWSAPRANYSFSTSLNESETYMIEWSATRNGDEIGQRLPAGGNSIVPVPIGMEWLNGFAMLAVVFTASLGSPRYGSTVAMGAVGMAGMFMLIGWLTIAAPAWWVAATIAVGAHLSGDR